MLNLYTKGEWQDLIVENQVTDADIEQIVFTGKVVRAMYDRKALLELKGEKRTRSEDFLLQDLNTFVYNQIVRESRKN